jgi:hypothetical protein
MTSRDVVKIGEQTVIPLWSVLMALPVMVGGVFWLTTVYSDGQANAQNIGKVERKVDKQNDLLLEINDRLIRVEQILRSKGGK